MVDLDLDVVRVPEPGRHLARGVVQFAGADGLATFNTVDEPKLPTDIGAPEALRTGVFDAGAVASGGKRPIAGAYRLVRCGGPVGER